MKVFTCDDHNSYFPVGVASIIIAKDEAQGKILLEKELEARGLGGGEFTLKQLNIHRASATILRDGNY